MKGIVTLSLAEPGVRAWLEQQRADITVVPSKGHVVVDDTTLTFPVYVLPYEVTDDNTLLTRSVSLPLISRPPAQLVRDSFRVSPEEYV